MRKLQYPFMLVVLLEPHEKPPRSRIKEGFGGFHIQGVRDFQFQFSLLLEGFFDTILLRSMHSYICELLLSRSFRHSTSRLGYHGLCNMDEVVTFVRAFFEVDMLFPLPLPPR
ncbi:hypothetical protein CRG98_027332 [Punica granatum]|uniref:Uncharacterized protein n=1 Tax=Punica granatum TaxID=22663 RepID=A0A2I0J7Q6_PUNGR|nr:hypothetical protein CRG98_027332 [Punica granatum]